jgi:hypothetical protein
MTEVAYRWYQPYEAPLALAGFAWFARDRVYNRMPRNFAKPFREDVEYLATNTAGGQIRFQTDSPTIKLKVKLAGEHNMDHMPATGQCGFDIYLGDPGQQRFAGVTRGDRAATEFETVLNNVSRQWLRNVTINMPLYQGVESVQVGLEEGAQVLAPPPYADNRPVVVYGTSITQGGCACRPGMLHTNILSRAMNRPFINLGFSGNGRGEPEVAEALASIADPAGYVLDYEANAGLEGLQNTLTNFIDILRAAHPKTPILVVSAIPYASDSYDAGTQENHAKTRALQRGEVERRQAAGDANIFFHDGITLLGDDFDECTVDGCHPTDLGFYRMAQGMLPVLNTVLADRMIV